MTGFTLGLSKSNLTIKSYNWVARFKGILHIASSYMLIFVEEPILLGAHSLHDFFQIWLHIFHPEHNINSKNVHNFVMIKVRVKLWMLEYLDFDLDLDLESTPNIETLYSELNTES